MLAGISQWVGLYHDDPERYKYSMRREEQFQELHKTDFTVLKDRRGGTTASMSLRSLENRILTNDLAGIHDFRSTCACADGGEDE